jgi:hypothetical protein
MFLPQKPYRFSLSSHTWGMFNEEETSIIYLYSPPFTCSLLKEITKTDLKMWAFISSHKLILLVIKGKAIRPVWRRGRIPPL